MERIARIQKEIFNRIDLKARKENERGFGLEIAVEQVQ
jgi:hypothetical protein